MNRHRSFSRVAIATVLLLIAPPAMSARAAQASASAEPRRDRTVEVVERVLPSVVNISTRTIIEVRDPFEALLRQMWGRRQTDEQISIGSGVIIDEEGYILTNEHVVKRATEIWVKLADGRERQADRVITSSRSDVALLQIRPRPGDKFTPIHFAADDDLLLGETVISLGNPFGLGGSVSRGILSSKNRRPPAEAQPLSIGDWLQTDAAINPGSSGGPLVNLNGDLIGLNVAISPEGEGIGFAIPIRAVMSTLAEIFTPEHIKGLWFGATVRSTRAGTDPRAELTVADVQPGSPADTAGLKKGDRIMRIDDREPRNFIEFNQSLTAAGAGKNVALTIRRGTADRALTVRLIEERAYFNAELIQRRLGLTLEPVPAELARRLPASWGGGFLVGGVDTNGPAADAKLLRGMIVTAIDGQVPGTLVEAAKLVHVRPAGGDLQINVMLLHQRGSALISQPGVAVLKAR